MPFTIIESHPTPNPNALKYALDKPIAADAPLSFLNKDDAADHPIATKLFTIPGVVGVMLLHDFVTLNKAPKATWKKITPEVTRVLAET